MAAASLKHRGFTLVELIFSLALFVFLILMGQPLVSDYIDRRALENFTQQLQTSLQLARSEALQQPSRVIVCHLSVDAVGCFDTQANRQTHWLAGLLIFQDSSSDRQWQPAERRYRVWQFSSQRCQLLWSRGDYLTFQNSGLLLPGRAGRFTLNCGRYQRQLVINFIGRVRLEDHF